MMLWPALLLLRSTTASYPTSVPRRGCVWSFRGPFLPWHNIDQEVKHVAFRQCARNIASLQRPPLVLLGMDPRSHRQFRDEDIATFREEDGSFGADHFHFGIGFHNLFDAREGELVDLVVVGFGFKLGDLVLPVGH